MHPETFDQVELPRQVVGSAAAFLAEGGRLTLCSFGTEVLTARLPEFVELEVADSGPSMKVRAERNEHRADCLGAMGHPCGKRPARMCLT